MSHDTAQWRSPPPRLPTILMGMFVIATLIAPASFVNKVVFLLMAFRSLIDLLFADRGAVRQTTAPFLVLGIFTYGFLISVLESTDSDLSKQFFLAVFILFLFYYVRNYQIDLDRLARISGIWLMAATLLYLYSKLLSGAPFSGLLANFFDKFSLSSKADRDYLGPGAVIVTLALGAVPFLFVPFCLWSKSLVERFNVRDLVLVAAALGCMALSGSRGLVAIGLVFLTALIAFRVSWAWRIVAMITAAAGMYALQVLYLSNTLILSLEDESNSVKLGHFTSYLDDLTWDSALFGRGLATFYYSSGSGIIKAHTEITPLDMARYFGIPLATLLFLILLLPTRNLANYAGKNAIYVLAFGLYLVLSATNPVLINSYGLLVVLWYWSKVIPLEPLRFVRTTVPATP
jgi:hypothetical protein